MSSKKILFGIRAKLVIIFILIKVIPLLLLAWIAWKDVSFLGKNVSVQTAEMTEDIQNAVTEIGSSIIKDSITALDWRSREAIERMTTDTARAVADFLYQRDEDIRQAAGIELTEESFRRFLSTHTKFVTEPEKWILSDDGKSWIPADPTEERYTSISDASSGNYAFIFNYNSQHISSQRLLYTRIRAGNRGTFSVLDGTGNVSSMEKKRPETFRVYQTGSFFS
jgi:hypothetical protein